MNDQSDIYVDSEHPDPGSWIWVAIAWLAVGVPLAWGIWQTLKQAAKLFLR
jgi:hypothetical protein